MNEKPVYLRVKPEYFTIYKYKYRVYGMKHDKIGNIIFFQKPYNLRNCHDSHWDILSEEEFKLEVL